MDRIARHAFTGFPSKNGWMEVPHGPAPEDDHLARAARAYLGIGGMPSGSGVWLVRAADAQGEGITGSRSYLIRFGSDRLPPPQACCSLSVFDRKACLEFPGVTVRHDTPRKAADGSVEILVQREPPGADAQGMWVKAPEGDFALMLRVTLGGEDGAGGGNWYPEVMRALP
jgi:hypothetical protein